MHLIYFDFRTRIPQVASFLTKSQVVQMSSAQNVDTWREKCFSNVTHPPLTLLHQCPSLTMECRRLFKVWQDKLRQHPWRNKVRQAAGSRQASCDTNFCFHAQTPITDHHKAGFVFSLASEGKY